MPLTSQDGLTDVHVGDFVSMEWVVARLFPGVPVVQVLRPGTNGDEAESPQPVEQRVSVSEDSLTLVPPDTLQEGARVTLTWQVAQVFPEAGTAQVARRGLGGTLAAPTPVTITVGVPTAALTIVPPDTVTVARVALPFSVGRSTGAAHPDMLPFGFAPLEGADAPETAPLTVTALVPATAVLGSPSFTLHVHGTGFDAESGILWNGAPEPTTVVSDTELTTGVNMATAEVAITLPVAVRNGDGTESTALSFTFTAAA